MVVHHAPVPPPVGPAFPACIPIFSRWRGRVVVSTCEASVAFLPSGVERGVGSSWVFARPSGTRLKARFLPRGTFGIPSVLLDGCTCLVWVPFRFFALLGGGVVVPFPPPSTTAWFRLCVPPRGSVSHADWERRSTFVPYLPLVRRACHLHEACVCVCVGFGGACGGGSHHANTTTRDCLLSLLVSSRL
eukprot:scaffold815_cov363-Pavlova_lutheri.AAC.8